MKRSIKITVGVLILALWFLPASAGAFEKTVTNQIRFLDYVENVEWYKINGQNIIIGWKGLPDNFYAYNHRAAVKASKSSIYKVYVWSVRYPQKDWSPGRGGHLCITTAKFGRFGKSSCQKH